MLVIEPKRRTEKNNQVVGMRGVERVSAAKGVRQRWSIVDSGEM